MQRPPTMSWNAAGLANLRGAMDSLDNLPSDVVLGAHPCSKNTSFVRWLLGEDVGAKCQLSMKSELSCAHVRSVTGASRTGSVNTYPAVEVASWFRKQVLFSE